VPFQLLGLVPSYPRRSAARHPPAHGLKVTRFERLLVRHREHQQQALCLKQLALSPLELVRCDEAVVTQVRETANRIRDSRLLQSDPLWRVGGRGNGSPVASLLAPAAYISARSRVRFHHQGDDRGDDREDEDQYYEWPDCQTLVKSER